MAAGIKITKTRGLGAGTFSPAQAFARVGKQIAKRIEENVDEFGKMVEQKLVDHTPSRRGKVPNGGQTADAWKFTDKQYGFNVRNNKPWVGSLNSGRWVSPGDKGGPKPKRNWVQGYIKTTRPKKLQK